MTLGKIVRTIALIAVCIVVTSYRTRADVEPGTSDDDSSLTSPIVEAFRVFGADPKELETVRDDVPLTASEFELSQKLLAILPRIDRVTRDRWERPLGELQEATIAELRWHVLSVAGHVTRVQRIPDSVAASIAPSKPHYSVDVTATAGDLALKLITNRLPTGWDESGPPAAAPIRCQAVLLKSHEPESQAILITDSIQWHPSSPDADFGVTAGAALLGQYGLDFNLLNQVVQRGQLTGKDRDCFYGMLWTMPRVPATRIQESSPKKVPIAKLLQAPDNYRGELFQLRGVARRAIKIQVTDPAAVQQYGIRSYYEIELFLPLTPSLRLIESTDKSERLYQNYPVTVCCRELPDGMPQGDIIRQEIEADGFLMKLWSYQSEFAAGAEKDRAKRQISPLFIAQSVRIPAPPTTRNSLPAIMLAAVVIGFAFGAYLLSKSYARGDARLSKWRQVQDETAKLDFDGLDDLTEPNRPD